jgi:hypothetical protein
MSPTRMLEDVRSRLRSCERLLRLPFFPCVPIVRPPISIVLMTTQI